MRSTRTGLAAVLVTMVAGLGLTLGTAGQAAASEHTTVAVRDTTESEVPWTRTVPGLLDLALGAIGGITDGEVPWT
ncbi:hypothetical protein ACFYRY_26865 [Streptomyces sp. NPDC005263]|uniref:hypothetical protein n=1 Tax=Streptomyces sp. NPDC005263 TaxID=3364711 RepID=UPI00369D4665